MNFALLNSLCTPPLFRDSNCLFYQSNCLFECFRFSYIGGFLLRRLTDGVYVQFPIRISLFFKPTCCTSWIIYKKSDVSVIWTRWFIRPMPIFDLVIYAFRTYMVISKIFFRLSVTKISLLPLLSIFNPSPRLNCNSNLPLGLVLPQIM